MSENYSTSTSLAASSVISVSVLNRLAREKLESAFPLCWVGGEISNLTYAASGHVYFSLKDGSAQVRCVMFRNRAQLLGWRLENGQHIEARVLVTLYEARGDFQLNVEAARKAGVGNLYEQFLKLKDKLEGEGLFDNAQKRALPTFPRRVGIVTSPQAAALRDILTTLARRAPHVDIVLYPTPVQGENAARQIVGAIADAGKRRDCEVLIVCRGGGSLEDLWAFNDETLARTIRASTIPIITGIGHETDFTIADFAADRRAPTPTAAAEMAAPERMALLSNLTDHRLSLRRQIRHMLDQHNQRLDWLARRMPHPAQDIAQRREALHNLRRRLDSGLRQSGSRGRTALAALSQRFLLARPDTGRLARRLEALAPTLRGEWQNTLRIKQSRLDQLAAGLDHLNPDSVLARGYSIVTNATGAIIRDSRALEPNDPISVCFHSGRADATVTSVTHSTAPKNSKTDPLPKKAP